MFCGHCGQKKLLSEYRFCKNCGKPFDSKENHPVDIFLSDDGIGLKKAVEDFERQLILQALEKTNWVKKKAASLLGLNRTTLVEKIKKLNIKN